MTKYVADTNILMKSPSLLDQYENVVILNHVLRELDSLKTHKDKSKQHQARRGSRYINNNINRIHFDFKDYKVEDYRLDNCYEDNKILQACLENEDYKLLSYDRNFKHIAKGYGVDVIELDAKDDDKLDSDYKGYKEVEMTEDELQDVYQNLDKNPWELLVNEYLIVVDEFTGKDKDAFKWDGQILQRVHDKGFKVDAFGKFKPKDFYQKSAVDSILHNNITRLAGDAGTGKSLIGLYTAWHLIERGKYERLIVFTNPVKTKDAEALGFYKGNRTEKLMDSQIGIMLASKFGDKMAVEMHITNNNLTLLPFSDIRGFDTTSEKKTIVYIPEAQNLNTELLKLGLQRVGENTKVIIDGDPNTQVDMEAYSSDNGMIRMSEVFRGNESYGEVELKNIYRSPIAELANKM